MSDAKLAIDGGAPVRARLLPYGRHDVDDDDVRAVTDVLRGDWLTTGPHVASFEQAFARAVGAPHAVAVASGTAALHLAYASLDLAPGDEVIVPAVTFAASANAALYLGAKPVFADVRAADLLIDKAAAAALITDRTRAIVAVDYAGQPVDVDELRALVGDRRIAIVTDSCHALGASDHKKPVGGRDAAASCFSLHPVKHITSGEGGVVTTSDERIARRVRRLRNHGIDLDLREREQQHKTSYDVVELGFNYRLSDIGCALAERQLSKLDANIATRRAIAARYERAFSAAGDAADVADVVSPLAVRAGVGHAWHLYVVELAMEKLSVPRDRVLAALRAEGIGVVVHYPALHLFTLYRERLGTKPGLCPVAERATSRIVSLPLFPTMSDGDVDDVVAAVRKVLAHYRR